MYTYTVRSSAVEDLRRFSMMYINAGRTLYLVEVSGPGWEIRKEPTDPIEMIAVNGSLFERKM